MTEFSNHNDQQKLKRMIEMFDAMGRIEIETEIGIEFGNTIKQSLEEIIKPSARDCYKQLK